MSNRLGVRLQRLPYSIRAALRHDWDVLRLPQSLVKLTAAGAVAGFAAQYLALTAAATTPVRREAQLAQWYESEPRVTGGLVASGKIRVVAFSDFQCPACSFQIPGLERTVARYQRGGHDDIELVLKDSCASCSGLRPRAAAHLYNG